MGGLCSDHTWLCICSDCNCCEDGGRWAQRHRRPQGDQVGRPGAAQLRGPQKQFNHVKSPSFYTLTPDIASAQRAQRSPATGDDWAAATL